MMDTFVSCLSVDPMDELTWLAMADWLEEHGSPESAELTRLTRRLASCQSWAEGGPLRARAWELIEGGYRTAPVIRRGPMSQRLALVLPGWFVMGSDEDPDHDERPGHVIRITKPFWLGVLPMSAEQAGVEEPLVGRFAGAPAVMGWSKALKVAAGGGYRLPTEAEWEYACRGGPLATREEFLFERPKAKPSKSDMVSSPSMVTLAGIDIEGYPANPLGLKHMHGLVSDWCVDWYAHDQDETDCVDPKGPEVGEMKVFRGGSWWAEAATCRAGYRDRMGDSSNPVYPVTLRVAL